MTNVGLPPQVQHPIPPPPKPSFNPFRPMPPDPDPQKSKLLRAIHDRLRDNGNYDLLDELPPVDTMRWTDHRDPNGVEPNQALVIGVWGGQDIIAYLIQQGEKPVELRFRTKSRSLLTDDIIRMKLIKPFKYLAGPSKADKGRISIFIKYYFIAAGVHPGAGSVDYTDLAKRFQTGLQIIREKQEVERNRQKNRKVDKAEDVVEETDPEGGDGDEDADSSTSPPGVQTRTTRRRTIDSPPPSPRRRRSVSDCDKLKDLLKSHGELHLLDNIPTAEEMQFSVQTLFAEAQPMKLFVGKGNRTKDDIYAYMRFSGHHHEIRFYTENGNTPPQMISADLYAKQQVWHPFSKCFTRSPAGVDAADKARITLMIKWYFIAADIAKNCVLKETHNYPSRFRNALAYIAEQMGSAAAKPVNPKPKPKDPADQLLDETSIQNALGADSRSSDTNEEGNWPRSANARPPTPTTVPPAAAPLAEPQKTPRKRTAEDAELESLQSIVSEDQELTKEINELDDRVDVVQMQLQALISERTKLNEKRKGVRKRLKRQSLVFATTDMDVE